MYTHNKNRILSSPHSLQLPKVPNIRCGDIGSQVETGGEIAKMPLWSSPASRAIEFIIYSQHNSMRITVVRNIKQTKKQCIIRLVTLDLKKYLFCAEERQFAAKNCQFVTKRDIIKGRYKNL